MSYAAAFALVCVITALIRPRQLGPWVPADLIVVLLAGGMSLVWCALIDMVAR